MVVPPKFTLSLNNAEVVDVVLVVDVVEVVLVVLVVEVVVLVVVVNEGQLPDVNAK